MKLGYYNHAPVIFGADGSARLPAIVGMFPKRMGELAGHPVTIFAHEAPEATGTEDMILTADEARFVSLGPRASAPARLFRPGATVARFAEHVRELDVMLIQGPTPLLPALTAAAGSTPVVLLIGGDYGSWVPQRHFSRVRNAAIALFMREYVRRQRRASRGRLVFIQNPTLAPTVAGGDVRTIPFSSVSRSFSPPAENLAEWPPDIGGETPVRLLYTGRIVRDKGVLEALGAVAILRDRGYSARLELVGWEAEGDPIADDMRSFARTHGIADRLRFAGYVPAGAELMERYRDAHVFVLATYWDSLPRSMQEAMAVGLPCVVSPVGGIGHYLHDGEEAIFVAPRSAEEIAGAVLRLVDDPELRRRVSMNAQRWSAQHSFEADCDTIFETVAQLADARAGR